MLGKEITSRRPPTSAERFRVYHEVGVAVTRLAPGAPTVAAFASPRIIGQILSILGLFFTSLGNSFLRPLPVYLLHDECSLTNRVLDSGHFRRARPVRVQLV